MKQFVFPAICYKDIENAEFVLLLPDTDIIASGESVEDAYLTAKRHLINYVDYSVKYDVSLPQASTFEETAKLNPKKVVLLVDAQTASGTIKKMTETEAKSFIDEFFE